MNYANLGRSSPVCALYVDNKQYVKRGGKVLVSLLLFLQRVKLILRISKKCSQSQ